MQRFCSGQLETTGSLALPFTRPASSLPGFCPPMHNNPPLDERTTRREKIFDIAPVVFLSRMLRERKDFWGGGCDTERILIGVFPVHSTDRKSQGRKPFRKARQFRGKICSFALIIRDATKGLYSHFCLLSSLSLFEYSRVEVIKIFTYSRPSEISLPSTFRFLFSFLSLSLSKYFSNIDTLCSFLPDASQRRRSPSVWIPNGEEHISICEMHDAMSRKIEGVLANSQPTSSSIHVVKLVR